MKAVARTDVRISACVTCAKYGLVSTETGRCTCEHNHPLAKGGYGCRMLACARHSERKALRKPSGRAA